MSFQMLLQMFCTHVDQGFVGLLIFQTDEVAHDQSLEMFDFMLLTELPWQEVVGVEVDVSVDNMVGGTADRIKGFQFVGDHESPVDQDFADASNDDQQQQPQQQQPPAALAIVNATPYPLRPNLSPDNKRPVMHTKRTFHVVIVILAALAFSGVPALVLGEMAQALSRYYCKPKTFLQTLTCPEHMPHAQFEDRHPWDCSHRHLELHHVAVAPVWGTSKRYMLITHI